MGCEYVGGQRGTGREVVFSSPCAGTITLLDPGTVTAEGELVQAGDAFARIDEWEIRWIQSAWLLEFLVTTGSTVKEGDPIVRLWA